MSLAYPSDSSRRRLNLRCTYTRLVLKRTSRFLNRAALATHPHDSKKSPSHRSSNSARVSGADGVGAATPGGASNALVSATSFRRRSSEVASSSPPLDAWSSSSQTSQTASARREAAEARVGGTAVSAAATCAGSTRSRTAAQRSSRTNADADAAGTSARGCGRRTGGGGGGGRSARGASSGGGASVGGEERRRGGRRDRARRSSTSASVDARGRERRRRASGERSRRTIAHLPRRELRDDRRVHQRGRHAGVGRHPSRGEATRRPRRGVCREPPRGFSRMLSARSGARARDRICARESPGGRASQCGWTRAPARRSATSRDARTPHARECWRSWRAARPPRRGASPPS